MPEPGSPKPEDEVDAVLAEFGGDARAAIKALLHDIEMLARYRECVQRVCAAGRSCPIVEEAQSILND